MCLSVIVIFIVLRWWWWVRRTGVMLGPCSAPCSLVEQVNDCLFGPCIIVFIFIIYLQGAGGCDGVLLAAGDADLDHRVGQVVCLQRRHHACSDRAAVASKPAPLR